MPFVLLPPVEYDYGDYPRTVREEPKLENTPWTFSLVYFGYCPFDPPGQQKTMLSPELAAELPHTIWMDEIPKSGIPDFLAVDSGFIISQRVRDKLEELEPGSHGFHPATLRHDRKKTELGTWYWHHLHQTPDIIDLDNTLFQAWKPEKARMEPHVGLDEMSWDKGSPRFWEINPTRKGHDHLINFKRPPVGHLWRGTVGPNSPWIEKKTTSAKFNNRTRYNDPLNRYVFCSDHFAEWMEAEAVTGFRPRKIIEKPANWYVETQWKG